MFHLLFVPCYLDYVQTDLGGGLLRPVTKLPGRAFSFHRLSSSAPPAHPHTPTAFPVILTLLPNAVTSYRAPKSLFSLSFHPSTLPSSILLSFPGSALLCSAVTLSSLARVFSHAYSVLDTEFYCHSVYMQVLWESGACGYTHCTGLCAFCI